MDFNRQTIKQWMAKNIPDDGLVCKGGQGRQIYAIEEVVKIINLRDPIIRVSIVGEHFSKSVPLPVFLLETDKIRFFVRDNFYDIKCSINSEYECKLPLQQIHRIVSTIDFEKEIVRCADSRQVPVDTLRNNDNWYHDWSGNKIVRKDGLVYFASSVNACYCEGIDKLEGLSKLTFNIYEHDYQRDFTLSLNSYFKLGAIIERIIK
jgi:hypothetical protein